MQKLPDVQSQLSTKDLFDAFKTQLVKDFERSNFSADFVKSLEPDYSHIHEAIALELQLNEKKSDKNLMRLLNRVDISESQLKKYLNANPGKNPFDIWAELIIKRILQKVVIKRFYKSNEADL